MSNNNIRKYLMPRITRNNNGNSGNSGNTIAVVDKNNKYITITINNYVECINSFGASYIAYDAFALCKELGINNVNLQSLAVCYSCKFLNALRGESAQMPMAMFSYRPLSPTIMIGLREVLEYYNIGCQ